MRGGVRLNIIHHRHGCGRGGGDGEHLIYSPNPGVYIVAYISENTIQKYP
jgi:hypothetical protein